MLDVIKFEIIEYMLSAERSRLILPQFNLYHLYFYLATCTYVPKNLFSSISFIQQPQSAWNQKKREKTLFIQLFDNWHSIGEHWARLNKIYPWAPGFQLSLAALKPADVDHREPNHNDTRFRHPVSYTTEERKYTQYICVLKSGSLKTYPWNDLVTAFSIDVPEQDWNCWATIRAKECESADSKLHDPRDEVPSRVELCRCE